MLSELLLGHLEQMMEWKVEIEVQVQLRINALSGRAVGLILEVTK